MRFNSINAFTQAIAIWFAVSVSFGCTQQSGTSARVQIQLPNLSSGSAAKSMGKVAASSGTVNWGQSDPTDLSGISCFLVTVGGAGMPNPPVSGKMSHELNPNLRGEILSEHASKIPG